MEKNVKRVIAEVIRLSREVGNDKLEPLVIGYVAVLHDAISSWRNVAPNAQLSNPDLSADEVTSIAGWLLPVLFSQDNPWLSTARLQALMNNHFKEQREIVEKEHNEKKEKCNVLMRNILSTNAFKSNSSTSYERFYKILFDFVCTASSMETALVNDAAASEVRAAMESVFPMSSVARFVTLSSEERIAQMEELARIVTGICIYNRATKGGGFGLPPNVGPTAERRRLTRDVDSAVEDLDHLLKTRDRFMSRIRWKAAQMASKLAVLKSNSINDDGDDSSPSDRHVRQLVRLWDEAVDHAQLRLFFRKLQLGLHEGLDSINQLQSQQTSLLATVKGHVANERTAVPKDVIYPLFDQLGAVHDAIQQELRMLVVHERLEESLRLLRGGFQDSMESEEGGWEKGGGGDRRLFADDEARLSDEAEEVVRNLDSAATGLRWISATQAAIHAKAAAAEALVGGGEGGGLGGERGGESAASYQHTSNSHLDLDLAATFVPALDGFCAVSLARLEEEVLDELSFQASSAPSPPTNG
eukprot:CAMPEP_0175046112 /NCGR_PEP_ID=MMETSP0052_2-20121109/4839_1 /TAXON_ID=51329 ORGANISM="Polytomella parva, Strain SAG 63-3" /NCGR_SAMPLE_ID=MMETSP0052_2 /ASSEMBLY_ACC=CAM_ASM_000194 /LENGTH=528 /DNA_ID=CAMNT_0016309801 /DNA_START=13 /DNA_END=1595 /DNA_ORIENTATION=-